MSTPVASDEDSRRTRHPSSPSALARSSVSTSSAGHPLPFRHLWPLEALPDDLLHRGTHLARHVTRTDAAVVCLLNNGDIWHTTEIGDSQFGPSLTTELCTLFAERENTTVLTTPDLQEQFEHSLSTHPGESVRFVVGTPLRVDMRPTIEGETSTVGVLFAEGTTQHLSTERLREHMAQLGSMLEEQIKGWAVERGVTLIFENLSEALMALDEHSRITFLNRKAEILLQSSRDDLLGQNIWTVFPEAIGSTAAERYRDAIENQQSVSIRTYHPRLQMWFKVRADPFEGGLLLYFDDITEQVERENELIAAKKEAEEASRLKSSFLANMSHEIRTPLTSIIGFAEAIQEQITTMGSETEEVDLHSLTQFTDLIVKGGHRLLELLNSLLNLSKLEADEMAVSLTPVDLTEETQEMIELFEPQAEAADVSLHADIPNTPVWGKADRRGVRIVLRNLLSNAVKYTDEGGWVRVRVQEASKFVTLRVADNGIGMTPDRLPELFEAFKQESTGPSRAYEGAGLGLAVTRRLVHLMNGSIDVETAKGEGSNFAVQFPRAHDPAES